MWIPERLKTEYSNFLTAPKWRRYVWLAVALFVAAYLAWCRFGPQPVKPGAMIAVHTSAKVADMERKAVTPKKVMVLTPKKEAVERLNLPPGEAANDDEEIVEATDAPASHYGTTTVTFLNMSTGQPRTVIRVKEAPWFSFERGNTLGVEVGIGSHGRYYQGDYQRDICQVKGVYLSGRGSVMSYASETDWRAGTRLEYRW